MDAVRSTDEREGSYHGSAAIPDLAAGPPKKAPINRWEHRYLGEERFPERLSALEIEHFFTLDEERRGPLNPRARPPPVGVREKTRRSDQSRAIYSPGD